MKYCPKCGTELNDDAAFCTKCGYAFENQKRNSGLDVAIKVLMILSCVAMGLFIIPLLWTIPMTVSVSNKMAKGEPIGVGLKVCTLLFVNTIAGILLLVRED